MKVTCISASNVRAKKNDSASVKMCEQVGELIKLEANQNVDVDILPLLDYELSPCIMCGECADDNICIYDEDFNKILASLNESDGVVLIAPLYASIPAKLIMLLEKLQELAYIRYVENDVKGTKEKFMLADKPVAIIGHGGMPEDYDQIDVEQYYIDKLVKPLSDIIKSVQMKVVPQNDERPNGLALGIKRMEKKEGKFFPEMVHDWESISERMKPLVANLIDRV